MCGSRKESTFPTGAEEGPGATMMTWDSLGLCYPEPYPYTRLGPLGHSTQLQPSSGLAVPTPRSLAQQLSLGDKPKNLTNSNITVSHARRRPGSSGDSLIPLGAGRRDRLNLWAQGSALLSVWPETPPLPLLNPHPKDGPR